MPGTFEGLGVPLNGAYTSYTSNGTTAVRTMDDYGVFRHEVAWTTSSTQVSAIGSWASFYGAANFKMVVTGDSGNKWLTGATISLDDSSTSGGHNAHGATIGLRQNADVSNYGGTASVLCLLYEEESGAVTPAQGSTPDSVSWIQCYNIDSTYPMMQLLDLKIHASGGCFATATNTVIDHALTINVNGTVYYIGLYDSKT